MKTLVYVHTCEGARVALLPAVTHSSIVKDAGLHKVSRSVFFANAISEEEWKNNMTVFISP